MWDKDKLYNWNVMTFLLLYFSGFIWFMPIFYLILHPVK